MSNVSVDDAHIEGQMSMWDDSLREAADAFPEPITHSEFPNESGTGTFPAMQVNYLSAPDGSVLAPEQPVDTGLTEADVVIAAQFLAQQGWTVFPPGMAPPAPLRPRARKTDPETSAAGAASVARRAGSQAHRLLIAYASVGAYGLTAAAAGHRSGLATNPQCGYWKRCSELLEDGLLETVVVNGVPETRRNDATGDHQEVRRITERGLNELKRLNEVAMKKEQAR